MDVCVHMYIHHQRRKDFMYIYLYIIVDHYVEKCEASQAEA